MHQIDSDMQGKMETDSKEKWNPNLWYNVWCKYMYVMLLLPKVMDYEIYQEN